MIDISDLLPHKGSARMLERVVAWDADSITAATATHRAANNPLRRDGRLASVHLIEYGAQAMALHGALRSAEPRAAQPALLVAARGFRASRACIEDLAGELTVTARALLITPSSWQYEFEVLHAGLSLASGRVAAMARPAARGVHAAG